MDWNNKQPKTWIKCISIKFKNLLNTFKSVNFANNKKRKQLKNKNITFQAAYNQNRLLSEIKEIIHRETAF